MGNITNDIKVKRVYRCNEFFTGLNSKNNENVILRPENNSNDDDITFLDVFMDVHFKNSEEKIEKTKK